MRNKSSVAAETSLACRMGHRLFPPEDKAIVGPYFGVLILNQPALPHRTSPLSWQTSASSSLRWPSSRPCALGAFAHEQREQASGLAT
jgi:hypothetical protein